MSVITRELADSLGAVKVMLLQDDQDGAMEILNRYKLIFPGGAPSIVIPPPARHWTNDAPTEPGWYWFAPYDGPTEIVRVFRVMAHGELRADFTGADFSLSEVEGTWYSEALSVPGPNGEKP
jgi:hypothetical protein